MGDLSLVTGPWQRMSARYGYNEKLRIKHPKIFHSHRRPPNRKSVGDQIEAIELDRIVKTEPQDNKQRRTLLLNKPQKGSWGFTLQSYGLQKKEKNEVDIVTYVDYVDMGGPSHLAGLRQGDVILSINGRNMEVCCHSEMVTFIKGCGNSIRMVVLFEDCVKKVELHMRYLKLQRLLTAKMYELRSLEQQERNIVEGIAREHDPRRLSLASYSSSIWNDDTTSFLSLRPDLDICPLTPGSRGRRGASSLHYSPSILSLPPEGRLRYAPSMGSLNSAQSIQSLCCAHSASNLHQYSSLCGGGANASLRYTPSVASLQLEGTPPLVGDATAGEFSTSSLPSKAKLRAQHNRPARSSPRMDRPFSSYGASPHTLPVGSRMRPRSLAVTAISEDGDYVTEYMADSSSLCELEMNDYNSVLGGQVTSPASPTTPNSVFHSNVSTPVTPKTSPGTMFSNGQASSISPKCSSSDLDLEYRLPPPGATPKFLHPSQEGNSSNSSQKSGSRSGSERSSESPASSPDASPAVSRSRNKQGEKDKPAVPTQRKTLSQPKHAILEKLQRPTSEPILLTFKPLATDLPFSIHVAEQSNHDSSGSLPQKKTRNDLPTLASCDCPSAPNKSNVNVNSKPRDHQFPWNPTCICGAMSPSSYLLRSPGAYSMDANITSPAQNVMSSPTQNGVRNTMSPEQKIACARNTTSSSYKGTGRNKASPVLNWQLEQLAQKMDRMSVDRPPAFAENGYGSSSPLSLSNSASSGAMDLVDSEDFSGAEEPLSVDESLFERSVRKNVQQKKLKSEDFQSYFECSTLTVPLEYINEETQDTVF